MILGVRRVDAAMVIRRADSRAPVLAGLGASAFDVGPFRADAVEVTHEGYQVYDALYARTGLQNYPRADGSPFIELRPFAEVRDSLPSYELRPLTDLHPARNVDTKTARFLARGAFGAGQFHEDDPEGRDVAHVAGRIAVWDAELQAKFDAATAAGKPMQLSMGYVVDIDPTPGVFRGQRYDAIQRNMRINHGAAVPLGRAGSAQVVLDSGGWDLGAASSLADAGQHTTGIITIDLGQWSRRDSADLKTQDPRQLRRLPQKYRPPMKFKIKNDAAGEELEIELADGATVEQAIAVAQDAMNAGFAKFIKKKKGEEDKAGEKKSKKDAADLVASSRRHDAMRVAGTLIGLDYAGKPTELEVNLDSIEAVAGGKEVRKLIEAMDAADQPGAARLEVRRAVIAYSKRDTHAKGLLSEIQHQRVTSDEQKAEAAKHAKMRADAEDEAAMTPTERRNARAS